jgi:iron complex outermembrane receptor protein
MRRLFITLILVLGARVWADDVDAGVLEVERPVAAVGLGEGALRDVSELDLDSLLEQPIVASTKTQQRTAQAPAVITVVSFEEIQARGYTTLAEVLRAVPGFYDVYDGVTHNVGVRGINGGAQASGNVIKLMIDGQPVDYRPTTGNFFGEELIPLELVERVEIIRGPASALYGANAFLGVVNLVTRSGAELKGLRLIARANTVREHVGGGGGAVVGGEAGPLSVVLGTHGSYSDRSGLALPSTSPLPGSGELSQHDTARPWSVFGKATLREVLGGTFNLYGSVQQLDAVGEFGALAPLTHGTRIAAMNQNFWATYEASPHEKVSIKLKADYFHATPSAQERLDIGRPDYTLVRNVGAEGFDAAAEASFKLHPRFTLLAGIDYVREQHVLQTFSTLLSQDVRSLDGTLLRSAGTLIHPDGYGERGFFQSGGGFLQGLATLGESFTAVGGLRLDLHNIYGINPSFRAGLVFAPPSRPLSIKLLYGSSFKAPSAEQLYTRPIASGDLLGNPSLKPQTAHTVELAAGWGFSGVGEVLINVFATNVIGRVEFVPNGLFLQAQNTSAEWVAGGELDGRFKIAKVINLRIGAGVARTIASSEGSFITGAPQVVNPLFPLVQVHALADYLLPVVGLKLGVEVSYIGSRSASQSNALLAGSAYELPGYVYTAASVALPPRTLFGNRETSASLRVTNPLGLQWGEPGFGGYDVPSPPIAAMLTVVQQL